MQFTLLPRGIVWWPQHGSGGGRPLLCPDHGEWPIALTSPAAVQTTPASVTGSDWDHSAAHSTSRGDFMCQPLSDAGGRMFFTVPWPQGPVLPCFVVS